MTKIPAYLDVPSNTKYINHLANGMGIDFVNSKHETIAHALGENEMTKKEAPLAPQSKLGTPQP